MVNRVRVDADSEPNKGNNDASASLRLISSNQVINLLSCNSLSLSSADDGAGGYNMSYNCAASSNATSTAITIYSGSTIVRTINGNF